MTNTYKSNAAQVNRLHYVKLCNCLLNRVKWKNKNI